MRIRTTEIRQEVVIPALPEEVYDALMDPGKHAQFTGAEASGSSDIGGEFYAWDGYITARNLELVRGERIVQEWTTTEWPEGYGPSRLEIVLKRTGQGTALFLVQKDVPEEQANDYGQGWQENYWDLLIEYFQSRR